MPYFKSAKFLTIILAVAGGLFLFNQTSGFEGLGERKKVQAQAHYMMGLFYENQEDFDRAIKEYSQAVGLESDVAAIRLHLAAVLIRKGDYKRAEDELTQAKGLEPDNLEAGLMLALIYTARNSPEKAALEYEEVLKKASLTEPKNAFILKGLAALYYQQKKFQEAIAVYKLILEEDPNDQESVFLLGSLFEEIGLREEAIDRFKEALKLKPDYSDALNSLGYLYAEDGRELDTARELIEKALSSDPDNGAYIDSLGWVYFKMGLIDKALEYLEKAGSILTDAVIYDHLGEAYFKKGLKDKAAIFWKKSLDLDPVQDTVREKLKKTEKDNG